jgi:hypothetical protein
VITFLILPSRTCAFYICYFVDVTSEEIFPEKYSYSEELSVKETPVRRIRRDNLRRATSEETQPPALTVSPTVSTDESSIPLRFPANESRLTINKVRTLFYRLNLN